MINKKEIVLIGIDPAYQAWLGRPFGQTSY